MTAYARRGVVQGGLAAIATVVTGCGRTATAQAEPERPALLVHRDPGCGCCEKWARLAEQAGFAVTLRSDPAIAELKTRLGVPAELASCHTAQVDGFVVEGHVPFEQIERLRRLRPAGVLGLAVPGMPPESPGMETGSGVPGRFDVLAFERSGQVRLFASYPAERGA